MSGNEVNTVENSSETSNMKTTNKSLLEPVNGLQTKINGDEFNEWELIGSSSFTHGFLVESLRNNDEKFIKLHGKRPIKKITASDVSKGKGYVSIVYKATVYFGDTNDKNDVYSTILKVPGIDSMEESFKENCDMKINEELSEKLVKAHQFECDFYNDLAKSLDLPVPKVYKTLPWIRGAKDGVIHMYDLSQNCKSVEMLNPLSVSQIMDVTKHLAKMHKNMLTRTDWHGKYIENQTTLNTIGEMIDNSIEPFLNKCPNNYHTYFKEMINKYKKLLISKEYSDYVYQQSWKDLNIPPILVHGDLWGGNLMWIIDEYDNPSHKVGAFIDWQIMHEGSIMADLGRIITICTEADVRRHLETFIFEFYYDELLKQFKDEKCPITLEQIKKAYQYVYILQASAFPLYAAFLTNMNNGRYSPEVIEAMTDKMILRAKYAYEDIELLLQNDFKWILEKFNC